jgi:hypothetical protein
VDSNGKYSLVLRYRYLLYVIYVGKILMAKYRGRTVKLNKPMRGDVGKFKVFVRNRRTGRVQKVNFGSKTMRIKKNIPARKKSFMARMGGVLRKVRGQKSLSPAYWSIKAWQSGFRL